MKHFLIVDDNFEHIDLLVTCIEGRFENEILVAGTASEALFVLENRQDIGAIICGYDTPKGNGGDVYQKYCELGYNIPFILLTTRKIEDLSEFSDFSTANAVLHRYIQKPYKMNHLLEILDDVLDDKSSAIDSKYRKVRSQTYISIHKTNFPLYVKINNEKMIQINQFGDDSISQIRKLQDKGLTFIYLTREDYSLFLRESYSSMSEILLDEKAGASQKIDAQFDSVDSFHEGLTLLGVPERSLALAQESMNVTVSNLEKVKGLGPVLAKILSRKGYVQQISLLTNYISVAIAKETKFGDSRTYEKLSFASMFMDLSLQDEKACAVIDVARAGFRQEFDFGTRSEILEHPAKSCELLECYMDLSTDIKTIIMEHHERPNGSGFPRKLTSSTIRPLSGFLILAHEFSHRLINVQESKESVKSIIEDLLTNYSSGGFKVPIEGFIKVFNLNKS
ncbi:response regulator [Halobacteriovorax sp. HLS]|uniref:response regulator n=1 Tax=Halobacteriovorax sp. HLS TaxID=2234000 RepID=UPI000FD7AE0B|nr:response regulator [Halobacteriovorax sp. HLS]